MTKSQGATAALAILLGFARSRGNRRGHQRDAFRVDGRQPDDPAGPDARQQDHRRQRL